MTVTNTRRALSLSMAWVDESITEDESTPVIEKANGNTRVTLEIYDNAERTGDPIATVELTADGGWETIVALPVSENYYIVEKSITDSKGNTNNMTGPDGDDKLTTDDYETEIVTVNVATDGLRNTVVTNTRRGIPVTVTKTWNEVEGTVNTVESITVEFQNDGNVLVPVLSALNAGQPGVSVNADGSVTLSRTGEGNSKVWPENGWTVMVPATATHAVERPVSGYIVGNAEGTVQAKQITLTNTRAACKVTYLDENGKRAFYKAYGSLTEAFEAVGDYTFGVKPGVQIEMLVANYALTDTAPLAGGRTATLTTADAVPVDEDDLYPGPGVTAVIKRGDVDDGSSMIMNFGTLTLGNLTLDGEKSTHTAVTADGGIVNNKYGVSLTVTAGATLRDSATSGNGGAIYGGTVNIEGGSITGNSSDNGAVNASVINISGAPSVTGNTMANGTSACNVYIDAADTIQVTGPITGGSIGVYATDAFKDSGEPFAQYDRTDTDIPGTLNHFVNDRTTIADTSTYLTGMDGTDGVAVWQMAKLTVAKVVTGGMGDTSRNFSFTLSLTGDTFRALKAANDNGTETNTLATFTADNKYTFTLKHGASEQLYLPLDRDITIAEADAGNYTTTIAIDGTEDNTATNRTVTVKLANGVGKTVTFTNDLPTVSPTGVDLRYAPYVLMLLAGIALIAVMVKRKKQ